ncbi:MAG: hypothetical protein RR382_07340 [Tannerellaceae bacterium]
MVIEARELLKLDQMGEEERLSYNSHLKNLSTEITNIDEALNKGRYEGLAEGLAKGLAEGEAKSQRLIASNMKSKGVPVDVIFIPMTCYFAPLPNCP